MYPDTVLWFGTIGGWGPLLACIGSKSPVNILPEQVVKKLKQIEDKVTDSRWTSEGFEAIRVGFFDNPKVIDALLQGYKVNTDDQPIIEFTNPILYNTTKDRMVDSFFTFLQLDNDLLEYWKRRILQQNETTGADLDGLLIERNKKGDRGTKGGRAGRRGR